MINIDMKESVDPVPMKGYPPPNHIMTSDQFFERVGGRRKWDLCLIDGLHEHTQVTRDIQNCLFHLNPGGMIMLHDCNPSSKERTAYNINGTCYLAVVEARCTREDEYVCTIDTDQGLGILYRGKNERWTQDPVEKCLNYAYFEKHRVPLLNLVSVEEFVAQLPEELP